MRNSIHTAGFSEIMHDARNDPAEACFLYEAVGRHVPGRGLSVRVGPALFGTVKSARHHVVDLGSTQGAADLAEPMHLALTGIASCAVTTLLSGGTAREMVFDNAEMLIEHPAAGQRDTRPAQDEGAVRCRLALEGATDRGRLDDLVVQMRSFSPNLATMTGEVPVLLECIDDADRAVPRRVEVADVDLPLLTPEPAACLVRWVSGMQLQSRPTGARPLRVDQPKQVGGVDWGPNPQEYLLMGLAGDLARQLAESCYQSTGERHAWEVSARACEDIRGLLLKKYDVVLLQDVTCSVVAPEGFKAGEVLDEIVGTAFARCGVRDLIMRPHRMDLVLDFGD